MAGLIQDAQAPVDPVAGDQGPQGGATSPDAVRAQMKIPPNLAGAYERVVLAGKKILYSDEMQGQISEMMKAPGDVGEKIGQGVVALMSIIISHANGTMPPQLIIPAATELVAEVGDFLKKGGMKVTDHDVAEGMAVMVQEILQRSGISADQLPGLLQQGGSDAGAPQPAAAPAAPADPAAAPTPQGV